MTHFPNEKLCDRAIVSANEHWLYLDFWPFIAYVYRTIFPGTKITLAFLTERLETDPFVAQLRRHGEVELVRPVRDVPQSAQAKLARYWVAMKHQNEVCLIDDVDMIPIDRDRYIGKTKQHKPGTMLFVGSEVYTGEGGQAPASMMTAEGYVFSALFNPKNLPFEKWLQYLKRGTNTHINIESRVHHEGLQTTTRSDVMGEALFSDEALIVELRKENEIPASYAKRDYICGVDTIDRSLWSKFNYSRLENGEYFVAHTGRPYCEYKVGNDVIIDYIRRRYHGEMPPEMLEKTPCIDEDMRFDENGLTREAFEWIIEHTPSGSMIIELGSGHVSTNYLSRFYRVVSVESKQKYVNLYPAHYIYAPFTGDGWFNTLSLREGLGHPRVTRNTCSLLVVDGQFNHTAETRADILNQTTLPLNQPIIVNGTHRDDAHAMAEKLAERTGRPAVFTEQYAVIA